MTPDLPGDDCLDSIMGLILGAQSRHQGYLTPAERLVVLTPTLLRAADELLAALADVQRHARILRDTLIIATEEE